MAQIRAARVPSRIAGSASGQGGVGLPEWHSHKYLRPHGPCFDRLVANTLQCVPCAADDNKVLTVDHGDVHIAWAADRFEPRAPQSSHGGKAGTITACRIHCLCAHDSEPQNFLLPQQPGAAPGGEFTNAESSQR